jgi:hypothetical protein
MSRDETGGDQAPDAASDRDVDPEPDKSPAAEPGVQRRASDTEPDGTDTSGGQLDEATTTPATTPDGGAAGRSDSDAGPGLVDEAAHRLDDAATQRLAAEMTALNRVLFGLAISDAENPTGFGAGPHEAAAPEQAVPTPPQGPPSSPAGPAPLAVPEALPVDNVLQFSRGHHDSEETSAAPRREHRGPAPLPVPTSIPLPEAPDAKPLSADPGVDPASGPQPASVEQPSAAADEATDTAAGDEAATTGAPLPPAHEDGDVQPAEEQSAPGSEQRPRPRNDRRSMDLLDEVAFLDE